MAATEDKPCALLPGLFGIFVQGLLFSSSMATLLYKKKSEEWSDPGNARSWPTFLMDSSKQFIGFGFVHVLNLVCAALLGSSLEGSGCDWYWVNIMIDDTVGVAIEYFFLKHLTTFFEMLSYHQGIFISGDYKDMAGNTIPKKYFAQLFVWLLCVTLMKSIVVAFMLGFHRQISFVAHSVVGLFSSAEARLMFVMVFTPIVMNAVQFWITDNFIKKVPPQAVGQEIEEQQKPVICNAEEHHAPQPGCCGVGCEERELAYNCCGSKRPGMCS
mmetsp:Transcript_137550/g.357426  ORF Transcript_137550/g.357426 Transcript_137550/m.357426 type:complete len:271 (+) Transcript_137550:122-934(+)